ncbi:hypothetical protein FOYG_17477 [Fusarium oxysporum NRRL 32931]|uniref:Uncharacterized protein n=1 Tax=Fusarium oxysporum NRRL 32931 TaxID=660029 RepID=W9HAU4_FUSOX|nr:hypothetical protein FOYG_17477 [Fusarium oxysporum NRRL 32931]
MNGAATPKVYCGAPAYRAFKSCKRTRNNERALDEEAKAEMSTPLSDGRWKLRGVSGLKGIGGWA